MPFFSRLRRRAFLRQTAAMMAGGSATVACGTARAEARTATDNARPTVALIPTDANWTQPLTQILSDGFQFRSAEVLAKCASSREDWMELQPKMVETLRGCDAVVYDGRVAARPGGAGSVDACTRGLFDLLTAANTSEVRLVIYLSDLELMRAYDAQYTVDEGFRPVPTAGTSLMSTYLGELVCREFAREGKLRGIVLRIDQREPFNVPAASPDGVTNNELARAIKAALVNGLKRPPTLASWEVFHLQSARAKSGSISAKASRQLGWNPDPV